MMKNILCLFFILILGMVSLRNLGFFYESKDHIHLDEVTSVQFNDHQVGEEKSERHVHSHRHSEDTPLHEHSHNHTSASAPDIKYLPSPAKIEIFFSYLYIKSNYLLKSFYSDSELSPLFRPPIS